MISRDTTGTPIRYREDGSIDATDSSFLTGMLGLFGSDEEDQRRHINNDLKLVRNKNLDAWSKSPLNTSRDQLIAWASVKAKDPITRLVMQDYASKRFINKDILLPHLRLYLYKQAESKAPLWLRIVGPIIMFLDIGLFCTIQNTKKVEEQHEINQILCLCNSYGKWALIMFFELHNTPDENMKDYFCGWRNQGEIYEMYLNWRKGIGFK